MRRWSSFIWLMVLFTMALLSGLILGWVDWPYAELWTYAKAAFASSENPSLKFFLMCAAITFLAVAVVLLLVAL